MLKQIIRGIAGDTVLPNILMAVILAAGLMAAAAMQRELFPDVTMDEILIEAEFPGASPAEVREGVMLKIQEAVDGMPGIAQVFIQSRENLGVAEIIVAHGHDADQVLDRIRSRVNAISTFPKDAESPVILREVHRSEVMKLFLCGEAPEAGLKETARQIRDRLRMIGGVSQVEISGARAYEIQVEITEADLRAHGLSLESVARAIAESNLTLAGGVIRTRDKDIRIRTIGRKTRGKALEAIAVKTRADGSILTLGQLARIRDGFSDGEAQVRVNGTPALILDIHKTRQEDALAISRAVTAFVEAEPSSGGDLTLGVLYDLTADLDARIRMLVKNGILGLFLVLGLLWFFLDVRLGFWVAMGIPVSILGALVVLWGLGGSINMLSLFGLIMVLGIVVDDAIIVGEAIFHHFGKGCSPLEAAAEGTAEVGLPVLAAISTTILAFLPLAWIGDVIGKFLLILPMVVIPCLAVSLLESVFLLPAHLAASLRKKRRLPGGVILFQSRVGRAMEGIARDLYLPLLKSALDHRYAVACGGICLACICTGLVLGNIVRFEVLPDTGSPIIFSNVKLPPGTPAEQTKKIVSRVEAALIRASRKTDLENGPDRAPVLKHRMTMVGSTLGEDPETGDRYGGVQAVLDRACDPAALLKDWETAAGSLPGAAAVSFEKRSEGPPGDPIEVWLRGYDPDRLSLAAGDLTRALEAIQGVGRVKSDAMSRVEERQLYLKPEALFLGLTPKALADQVRGAFYGWEAMRIQRGRDDLRIKVRHPETGRRDLDALERLSILTPQGARIPLHAVARIESGSRTDIIREVDGIPCIALAAPVDETRVNAEEIIDSLSQDLLPGLHEKYPGLTISFEGEEKHMKDALGGLFFGFPLALLGIYAIVAALFRSYTQPFLILAAVPLGFSGSIIGHLFMHHPLSLMSIFGMVALSGIVVNDAIMLIDRINTNLNRGMAPVPAVLSAGRRRFRAIILTTLSTLGGLAPLLAETDIQAGMIIPMAISISGGLVFATVLTLVYIPCLFLITRDLAALFSRDAPKGGVEKPEHLAYTNE